MVAEGLCRQEYQASAAPSSGLKSSRATWSSLLESEEDKFPVNRSCNHFDRWTLSRPVGVEADVL
jgi:hypothetical protein